MYTKFRHDRNTNNIRIVEKLSDRHESKSEAAEVRKEEERSEE